MPHKIDLEESTEEEVRRAFLRECQTNRTNSLLNCRILNMLEKTIDKTHGNIDEEFGSFEGPLL